MALKYELHERERFLSDAVVEYVALEGYNLDTVRNIKKNPKLQEILECLSKAKIHTKLGKNASRARDSQQAIVEFRNAKAEYERAILLSMEYKKEVDVLEEPAGWGQKMLSWFTPLFMWEFPRTELDSATFTGNTYKSYYDTYSQRTSSAVKRDFQERFNLFIKNCNESIADIRSRIAKEEKRMK